MTEQQPAVPTPKEVAAAMEAVRRMTVVLSPVSVYMQEQPEWLAELERARAEDPGPCRCLCGPAHHGGGICQGDAEPGLVRVRHTNEIPMCRPCYEAGLVLAPHAEVTGR